VPSQRAVGRLSPLPDGFGDDEERWEDGAELVRAHGEDEGYEGRNTPPEGPRLGPASVTQDEGETENEAEQVPLRRQVEHVLGHGGVDEPDRSRQPAAAAEERPRQRANQESRQRVEKDRNEVERPSGPAEEGELDGVEYGPYRSVLRNEDFPAGRERPGIQEETPGSSQRPDRRIAGDEVHVVPRHAGSQRPGIGHGGQQGEEGEPHRQRACQITDGETCAVLGAILQGAVGLPLRGDLLGLPRRAGWPRPRHRLLAPPRRHRSAPLRASAPCHRTTVARRA